MSTITFTKTTSDYPIERDTLLPKLDTYIHKLGPKEIEESIVHSSHGLTDLTLVCNNTSCSELPALFILKFTTPCLNLSARVNSIALQKLGMNTPTFYSWDAEAPISKYASTLVKNRFSIPTEGKHFSFMEIVPGADLGHLLSTQALFKLSKEDWHQCLRLCGKVAVFDLLLANDDRFYRPHPHNDVDETPPFCNKGNMMFHLTLEDKKHRALRDAFCIDNASSSVIRTRKKDALSKVQQAYLDKIHKAFTTFHNVENRKEFARIIFSGISNHIRQNLPHDRQLRKTFLDHIDALPTIMKGIEEGYRQISDLDTFNFLRSLEEAQLHIEIDPESAIYMQSVFLHVRKCLEHLNEGQQQ